MDDGRFWGEEGDRHIGQRWKKGVRLQAERAFRVPRKSREIPRMHPEKLPKRVLSAGVAEGKRASGATGRRSRSVAKETRPLDARRVCFLQEEEGC